MKISYINLQNKIIITGYPAKERHFQEEYRISQKISRWAFSFSRLHPLQHEQNAEMNQTVVAERDSSVYEIQPAKGGF
jgi:hypothetical protein